LAALFKIGWQRLTVPRRTIRGRIAKVTSRGGQRPSSTAALADRWQSEAARNMNCDQKWTGLAIPVDPAEETDMMMTGIAI